MTFDFLHNLECGFWVYIFSRRALVCNATQKFIVNLHFSHSLLIKVSKSCKQPQSLTIKLLQLKHLPKLRRCLLLERITILRRTAEKICVTETRGSLILSKITKADSVLLRKILKSCISRWRLIGNPTSSTKGTWNIKTTNTALRRIWWGNSEVR